MRIFTVKWKKLPELQVFSTRKRDKHDYSKEDIQKNNKDSEDVAVEFWRPSIRLKRVEKQPGRICGVVIAT